MSHVTVGWVLSEIDRLTPNPFTAEEKRHWLAQAEAFAALEMGLQPPAIEADEQELLVELPYDALYLRYMEAQIHYASGEMTRYNNAITAWNELLLTWRDFRVRGGVEPQRVSALKLC